jgi:hypothetical protein
MKNERIKNWEQTKEQLKKEFPDLMKDDLLYELEKDKELLKRLQEKLNKNKHEIRKWLSLMG